MRRDREPMPVDHVRIVVLRRFSLGAGRFAAVGETLIVPAPLSRQLVAARRAKVVADAPGEPLS
jgi:hypothetical protein